MKRLFLLLAALLPAVFNSAAQGACPSRLLVSGFFSTVHVYDACTGAWLQDLDAHERLDGAQAIRLGPDGLIYVVAEQTASIYRYRADTLAFVDLFAATPPMAPLGLDFAADGTAYVAGFSSQDVKMFDRNGTLLGSAFPPGASGIFGPEIGTMFGPDGNLYVPGFSSNNVIRYDPRTRTTTQVIAPRQNGILQPRGLLAARDGVHLYVVAEGSGQLLRFDIATGELTEMRRGLIDPTMLAWAPNGELLVVENNGVSRLDPDTGARLGTLVESRAGGLLGATFMAVIPIPVAPPVDTVAEFYNATLDHYFVTANPDEAAAVDHGGAGPGWARTGGSFRSGGTTAVCRFYGSQSPGPNSHFYTIDADECQALKALQASTPASQKRWNFENNDFLSTPPAAGACPAATVPVYRAYNNGFARGIDSNHRLSSDRAAILQTVARGWRDEGIVMCAPQ